MQIFDFGMRFAIFVHMTPRSGINDLVNGINRGMTIKSFGNQITHSLRAVTFAGGKFYIAAMKDRVHVGFAVTGLIREDIALFEGSGKTMRHIKMHSVKDVDEKKLVKLIKIVDKKAICKPC